MQARNWHIPCLVMLIGSTFSFAIAQDIPIGPKLERYTRLWEHNPFAPEAVVASAPQPSPLDGFLLSSWLREDGRDVILVQNLQTADIVRITTEPNRDKLRLIRVNVNPDPRLVEAVISDGNEQRAIKFRFDGQALPETPNEGAGQPLSAVNTGGPGLSALPPLKAQDAQLQDATTNATQNQGHPYRIYPGLPRVHHDGSLPQPPSTGDNSVKRTISHSKFVRPNADRP